MQVNRSTIYYWKKRYSQQGIVSLHNRPKARVTFTELMTVYDISTVFQYIENNPKIGHYRVKMFLNGIGRIFGHTKIWEVVSIFREATEKEKQFKDQEREPSFPFRSEYPHHHWFCDVRYLVKQNGQWVYSILILDGYTRKILSGGVFLHQDFVHFLIVLKDALQKYGSPLRIVSDNAGIFKTKLLLDGYDKLHIDYAYIEKGKPWQNLTETLFSIEERLLDSYVLNCDSEKQIFAMHQRFINEYNDCGHWHHKSRTKEGQLYYKTPNAVMESAIGTGLNASRLQGRTVTAKQLERLFAYRHCTRTVDKHGQIKLDHHRLYIDDDLYSEKVDVYIEDTCLIIEHQDRIVAEYPCDYDNKKKRVTRIDTQAIWWTASLSRQLVFFSQALYRIVYFVKTAQRMQATKKSKKAIQMTFDFISD